MPPITLPYISVQPDWDQVVRDIGTNTIPSEPFWVSCYKAGKQSVHAKVIVEHSGGPLKTDLEGVEGINVKPINSRSFNLSCPAYSLKDILIVGPKHKFSPFQGKELECMNVSLDGNLYAAGSGKDISIGKLSDGQALRTLEGHLDDVTVVQFFPSNQVLLSGASDFQVKIWSVLDGSNPVTLRGHTSAITDLGIVGRGKNVLSSSRDGTVRLWHCGTGSTITVLGDYGTVVNKISVVPLPAKYASITVKGLDEKESETLDKMVLVGLNNGAIHGIHLGTKQELFSTPLKDAAITAIAYDNDTSTLCTGDSNGVVEIFSLSDLSKPVIQWKRNDHAVTGLGTRLNENGARVLCVSNADGSVYQTNSFDTVLSQSSVALEVEYTGNELEPVRNMVVLPSTEAVGFHRIACGIRGGNINIY